MFKREEIENKEKYVYILKTGPAAAVFKGARLSFQRKLSKFKRFQGDKAINFCG
jgi:hypothetical protein